MFICTQHTHSFCITHHTVPGCVDNPDSTVVVENKPPCAWNGRKFDIGIYKCGNLLLMQKGVHVGDQVDFIVEPKLCFAVCRNIDVGDFFPSLEIVSYATEFDLTQYPQGMEVVLSETPGGGRYIFTSQNKYVCTC